MSQDFVVHILCWLRRASLLGQWVAIGGAVWIFGGAFNAWPLVLISLIYGLWHGLFEWRGPEHSVSETRVAMEVALDLSVLASLLFFAGGWTNPFTSVLLVPLAFAAATLPWQIALPLALYALAGYGVLAAWHVPLPSVHGRFGGDFNVHVFGMWASFIISAVVAVAAIASVRAALEQYRRALTDLRESRLRDEQILAVGALAANTAHELATPLGSALLIAEELDEERGPLSPQRIRILRRQLHEASSRLKKLVGDATATAESSTKSWAEILDRLTRRFSLLRPDITLHCRGSNQLVASFTDWVLLESALLNLMVNAADASKFAGSDLVELQYKDHNDALQIVIRDFGLGISAGAANQNGAPKGLGIGLLLSSATIERFAGEVQHRMAPAGPGTEVTVLLPRS